MERATRSGGENASLAACSGGKLDLASSEKSRGIIAVGEGGAERAGSQQRSMFMINGLIYVFETGTYRWNTPVPVVGWRIITRLAERQLTKDVLPTTLQFSMTQRG